MKPIAVLRNDPIVPPGYLGDALDRAERQWGLVRLDEGEALPLPDQVSAVVALGGTMGAYQAGTYPYLDHEKRFLAACVDAGVPLLGICLGSQLLAESLGGEAYLAEVPEAAFAPVALTDEGAADPVVKTLAGRPVLRLHQDTWEPPPGSTTLAEGGVFLQAFRIGSAIGIQPHPEAGAEICAGWLADDGARKLAIDAGADPDELIGSLADRRAESEQTAARFFAAWLNESTVASSE